MYKNTLFCTHYICSQSITVHNLHTKLHTLREKVYSSLNFEINFLSVLHTHSLCSDTSGCYTTHNVKKFFEMLRSEAKHFNTPFCSINFFSQFFSPLLLILERFLTWRAEEHHNFFDSFVRYKFNVWLLLNYVFYY